MFLQEVKAQVFKLPPRERLSLVAAIIESLQDTPVSEFDLSGAIQRMRGLLKTDRSAIFYIAQKHTRSIKQARQAVAEILTVMTICPVDDLWSAFGNRAVLKSAFNSGLTDFEDAVQIFCAVTQGLDAILTRDKRGFVSSPVPVLSIGDLLQQLGSKNSD